MGQAVGAMASAMSNAGVFGGQAMMAPPTMIQPVYVQQPVYAQPMMQQPMMQQ